MFLFDVHFISLASGRESGDHRRQLRTLLAILQPTISLSCLKCLIGRISTNWQMLQYALVHGQLFRISAPVFGISWHDLMLECMKRKPAAAVTKLDRHRRSLLGKLSNDLDYLEGLAEKMVLLGDDNEQGLKEGINVGNKLRRETNDALDFLKNRQDFWSQYQPMYTK